ncbi:MerR family transcriptional regulator, partial [Acinetobacter baumannii]|nr:MerR family transcriptional regulator [Acinetobacter baumannii]
MSLKIGELSRLTGCPVVTIRFYEKEGLLAEPERTEGNDRIYNKTHLERLQFILNCRLLNMNLDEIQSLISFKMKPCGDCSSVNLLIDKHIL